MTGAGSITSDGLYTPPADLSEGASAVLVGTSALDLNVTAKIYAKLLLPSGAPIAVRIDTGSPIPTTDLSGNVWAADPGIEGATQTGVTSSVPGDYPHWVTSNPVGAVYESLAGGPNDLHLTVAMPNGNYLVHTLFGVAYNGCWPACGSRWTDNNRFSTYTFNPQVLETQGQVQNHLYNFGALANYQYATPVDAFVPARVLNNILEIGIYSLAPDSGPNYAPTAGGKINILNGIEILPDPAAPHWVIDTQQQTSIASGADLQLFVVDYYTGSNVATWSVLKGAALISNSGLLSLPQGSKTGDTVIVKAASVSNSNVFATATLCIDSCLNTGARRRADPLHSITSRVTSLGRLVVNWLKQIRKRLIQIV
jgi:hypothetical protein